MKTQNPRQHRDLHFTSQRPHLQSKWTQQQHTAYTNKNDAPSAGFVIYAGNHQGMPCTLGLSGLNQPTAWTSKADLDLGGAPAPCEGVQQSNVAEEHVLPAVAAAEGCQVAVIRQGQGGVAVAGAGGLTLYLRCVLCPLPCICVQGIHLCSRYTSVQGIHLCSRYTPVSKIYICSRYTPVFEIYICVQGIHLCSRCRPVFKVYTCVQDHIHMAEMMWHVCSCAP